LRLKYLYNGSVHCYFWMIYIAGTQNFIFDENIIDNNTLICEKAKTLYEGRRDNSYQNLILLKIKLSVCQTEPPTLRLSCYRVKLS
jgi:hypothetical protein